MGLAASQGRLLLLTARKSDLELQAQQISQDRLLLSIQQESIATEYAEKTNNQIYQIQLDDNNGFQPLSVAALNSFFNGGNENSSGDNYRVYDTRTGKIVPQSLISQYDGKKSDSPDSAFQRNLVNGYWLIQTKDNVEDSPTRGQFVTMTLAGQSNFRQTYYTEDDGAAKAQYDAAMARVQRLDKQLELKLNQVETQHKAVETEVESVDKIISNNIEGSFKYFS